MNTDETRKDAHNLHDLEWYRSRLYEALGEIDRLEKYGRWKQGYDQGWKDKIRHEKLNPTEATQIEQRTKGALRVRLKIGLSETFVAAHGIKPQGDEITVTHEDLITWIDEAIDSVGGK